MVSVSGVEVIFSFGFYCWVSRNVHLSHSVVSFICKLLHSLAEREPEAQDICSV